MSEDAVARRIREDVAAGVPEEEAAARALEDAARQRRAEAALEPPRSGRRLMVLGLTLLWLFTGVQLLVAPRFGAVYRALEVALPAHVEFLLRMAAGMAKAWPAVLAATAFLSAMLMCRPTRAAGAVMVIACTALLGILFLAMTIPLFGMLQRIG